MIILHVNKNIQDTCTCSCSNYSTVIATVAFSEVCVWQLQDHHLIIPGMYLSINDW